MDTKMHGVGGLGRGFLRLSDPVGVRSPRLAFSGYILAIEIPQTLCYGYWWGNDGVRFQEGRRSATNTYSGRAGGR
ncbi:hypothetical protein VTH06DRAFT_698 [Thermothelomyces fergusii]